VRLTESPQAAHRDHLAPLRTHGLTDEDILVLVHVIGYFNHINRIADALGVDLEPEMPPSPY
jgi:alkylhydroperoxidase family enzyme